MFSTDRKDAETAPGAADRKQQPPSIISASLKIVGNLISEGPRRFDTPNAVVGKVCDRYRTRRSSRLPTPRAKTWSMTMFATAAAS